jgi:ankyrin repeat protein
MADLLTTSSLLFLASIEDRKDKVAQLLDEGEDPLWTNERGASVIQLFAKRNQKEMAELCYERLPADQRNRFVNSKNVIGWTPLMAAAENNSNDIAKWLISMGADVNAKMVTGWTALHAASKKDNAELVSLLLSEGADKTTIASHRKFGPKLTPLSVACGETVKQLLSF